MLLASAVPLTDTVATSVMPSVMLVPVSGLMLATVGAAGAVVSICSVPGGVKVVQDRVDAQGKASTGEFTIGFDGKDYPISGDPFVDRLSLKRVDAYRVDGIGKKDDKTATTFIWQVSKDGKTLTYTTKRLYPPERVATIIQILDKQD